MRLTSVLPKLSEIKWFGTLYLVIQVLSIISYQNPTLEILSLLLVIAVFFVITYRRYIWGIYLIFIELFLGGYGRTFFLPLDNIEISLRQLMLLSLFSVWIISGRWLQLWKERSNYPILKYYLMVMTTVLIGVLGALKAGHPFKFIFVDANSFLYLGLIFLIITEINHQNHLLKITKLLIISNFILAAKTLFYLIIYALHWPAAIKLFYPWERINGNQLGQISNLSFRIFHNSNIYSLALLMGALTFTVYYRCQTQKKLKAANKLLELILLSATFVVLASFFRSFWVGLVVPLPILIWLVHKNLKIPLKSIQSSLTKWILKGCLLLTLILSLSWSLQTISWFPPLSYVEKRLFSWGERAVVSRVNSLKTLSSFISKKPLLGYGFGQEITYSNLDPRLTDNNLTTYKTEWGYLDTWLKLGLLGLLGSLSLVFKLLSTLWQKSKVNLKNDPQIQIVNISLLLALLALLITHNFSPFLNHPLGIGILLLITSWIQLDLSQFNKEKN